MLSCAITGLSRWVSFRFFNRILGSSTSAGEVSDFGSPSLKSCEFFSPEVTALLPIGEILDGPIWGTACCVLTGSQMQGEHQILIDSIKFLAKRIVPLKFRCKPLPFKCCSVSIFLLSMKYRECLLHSAKRVSFTI